MSLEDPRVRPLELRMTVAEVRLDKLDEVQNHHVEHHMEISRKEARWEDFLREHEAGQLRQESDRRADQSQMVNAITYMVNKALASNQSSTVKAVNHANLLQVAVILAAAGIWVGGSYLHLGWEAITGGIFAVLGLAAYFVRAARKAGKGPPSGTGFTSPPPGLNGGHPK